MYLPENSKLNSAAGRRPWVWAGVSGVIRGIWPGGPPGVGGYLGAPAGVGCLWDGWVSVGSEHWAGRAGDLWVGGCQVCAQRGDLLTLPAQKEVGTGLSVLA